MLTRFHNARQQQQSTKWFLWVSPAEAGNTIIQATQKKGNIAEATCMFLISSAW